jgi:O-glycosyl hydrolase
MKKTIITLGALVTVFIAHAQVNITIDKTKQYQKIEGFGGLAQESYSWGPTPVMSDNLANDFVNDLGCTIFRHIIDGGLESSNDNNDPNSTDLSKFILGSPEGGCNSNAHQTINQMTQTLKKLRNLVEKNGEKCLIYGTVFSPPDWMKYVNCVSGLDPIWNRMATLEDDKLKGGTNGVDGVKDFKDEFAEFSYAYLQIMKNNGVEVDAYSIQNEPVFPQSYSSCFYSPESYFAVFKTVGQYLRNKGLNTRLIFTEDIGDLGRYNQFVAPISRDAVTAGFADIAAVHSYAADGRSAGSTDAKLWVSLDKVSRQRNANRAFWQTETSGYSNDYAGAIDMGISIYTGLKYGKLNAWMFHGLTHPTAVEGLVINNGQKTDRYYAAKHYFKYIRPGAISVDALSSDEEVLSTAFQHNDKKTLSIVLINYGSASKQIKLAPIQNSGMPTTYKVYETSSSAVRCQDKGSVSAGSLINMPANSILTLVGENSLAEIPSSNDDSHEQLYTLEVSPNPATNNIKIARNANVFSNETIQILNMQGVEVMKVNMAANETEKTVSVESLQNGIYLIKNSSNFIKIVVNK